jgi:hypothetical protein
MRSNGAVSAASRLISRPMSLDEDFGSPIICAMRGATSGAGHQIFDPVYHSSRSQFGHVSAAPP